ncbi:MAG TPA: MlaD family protein, partial [Thermoleophilaceae bacterium]|nr:MlaD family protein [Thermoleophilaceae bacterium]
TVARILALAALIAAVALVALAMFGGPEPYKVKAVFQNAGQLVPGNEVRVGGQPIGKISDIDLDQSANAIVTMEVGDPVAPLHEGTSATIRATSLSGITSRYISLKPGPNNGRELGDGDRIGSDETSAPVDLDTLFNTLDAKTREGLRNFIRGSGTQYDGRGAEAGQSIQYFAPFLGSTSRLTQELALDQQVLEQFVKDGADTVSAIASRRGDLTDLVSNTNSAMRAIGDENVSLQRALELLPSTLRKANTTFVNLRNTLDDLDKLVEESKPNTKELAPFFRALRPLVHDARPTVADLRDLIRSPGPNNDLIELTAKQPRLAELTASVFPRAIQAFDRSDPVISYARNYTPDLAAWITKFGQVAAYYDANGHYARVMPVFSPTKFDRDNYKLVGIPATERLTGFERGTRPSCSGAATQPAPDGSSPRSFGGCDPSSGPPSEDPPG